MNAEEMVVLKCPIIIKNEGKTIGSICNESDFRWAIASHTELNSRYRIQQIVDDRCMLYAIGSWSKDRLYTVLEDK